MSISVHYFLSSRPFLWPNRATEQLSVRPERGQMEGLRNSMPHKYFISQRERGSEQIRRGQGAQAAYLLSLP